MQSPYPAQPADPYYGGYPEYSGAPAGGIDIKDLLGIARRRRSVILTTVLVVTSLAVLAGLLLTPKYTATALVMINPQQSKVLNLQDVMSGLSTDASTIESQIKLIKSEAQNDHLMETLGLYDDPDYNVALQNPDSTVQQRFAGPFATLVSWVPNSWLVATGLADEAGSEAFGDVPELQRFRSLERFMDNLKVTQEGRSYVINIGFKSPNAQKAAWVANKAAELYVQAQVDEKRGETEKASDWLGSRLEQLQAEVESAESAAERFKVEHGLAEFQGSTLKEQRILDLNHDLSQLRSDFAAEQAKLKLFSVLRGKHGQGLDSIPEVLNSPTIIDLRQRETELLKDETELRNTFGEKHPRLLSLQAEKTTLEAKINSEIERIRRTIENDTEVMSSRIKAVQAEIDDASHGNSVDHETEVKLRSLEREADAAKNLYEAFLQRYKETREQTDIVEPDAKVISTASPPNDPSTPGPVLFGAVGFTSSIMLGTLLAMLLERLDSGLRSGKQVESVLGIPALGLVPRVDRLKRNQKPHQYLIAKPLSAYAEAIRAIYTSMQLSDVDNPPKVVLVTSSLPQEGKTTLSVSLATFAARSAQKVLLMDLDLRHPSIQRDLSVEPAMGFVEYMAGERLLEEVIQHNEETGLDYLPVKRQTANPTDLLGSQKMKQLIQQLRGAYDYIVINSAPLLGVTDTKVAALLADKVLFATQWEKTTKDTALNGLASLREIKASVAGAVLTQVDVVKHAQYGYGDVGQYYGKYQKYYVN